MSDIIELRFEFPNGTVVRALDYACGYEYENHFNYRKSAVANAIHLSDYKIKGYLIISIRDYVTIKKAIQAKLRAKSSLNALFSFTGNDFNLTQSIKDFRIFSQQIARKISPDTPEESVRIDFVAKELTEEM